MSNSTYQSRHPEPAQARITEDLQSTPAKTPEPVKETENDFLAKIAKAKREQADTKTQQWVETSPEIMAIFNRNGLGIDQLGRPIKHFIHSGIMVCEFGKKELVLKEMHEQLGRRIHGDGEGLIMTGQAHLYK